MKKIFIFGSVFFVLTILLFTSCVSTQNYTARVVNVNQKNLQADEQTVEMQVDFSKKVTAESSCLYVNKRDAINDAYYQCLMQNKIDVVIDPIIKITKYPSFTSRSGVNSSILKQQYKAEITGFAGIYKKTLNTKENLENLKNVELQDILKYKLLTDPEFGNDYIFGNHAKSNVLFKFPNIME